MLSSVLDFETEKIENRPVYPPRAVGVAIKNERGKSQYYAWGHPRENNCTKADARRALKDACEGNVLMHGSKFDLEVLEAEFGLQPKKVQDSLYIAFLHDPRAWSLALKDLSVKHLDRQPYEQSELNDWIRAHFKDAKRSEKRCGEHIADAPGGLVGKYAIADVDMTHSIYNALSPQVFARGMRDAYLREIAVTPITLAMERGGIRVDMKRLKRLTRALSELTEDLDDAIRGKLGYIDVGSGPQLGKALAAKGLLTRITKTPTGRQSTAQDTLIETCSDKKLVRWLRLRATAVKYNSTFVKPWIEGGTRNHGYAQTHFHQTRGTETAGGARTGRYSSGDPTNFQNIPSNIEESKNAELLKDFASVLEGYLEEPFLGLRDYLLPDPGMFWCAADYDQQELRILAHFEKGRLMKAYHKNPKLDVHEYVRQLIIEQEGVDYPRKFVKTVVFMLLYGGGVKKLAVMLDIDFEDAERLRNAVLDALPGVRDLMYATNGETITTWGGRVYAPETPKRIEMKDRRGNIRTNPLTGKTLTKLIDFGYKQLNVEIQGSAADITKEGMRNVFAANVGRIALQVHDELGVMVKSKRDALRVTEAMCDLDGLNVPMTATPKLSKETWARCKAA